MNAKPIPATYTCYLLRSTTKSTAHVYIGSTPNPLRRWRQHNGLVQGGAKRTAHAAYRPWEMCLIVYGFPSKLSALQFEWAWQHTAATRHVKDLGYDTGHGGIRGQKKGTSSVPRKLADLHALLQSTSFCRWPLGVRFFARDVHQSWKRVCEKSNLPTRTNLIVTIDALSPPLPEKKPRAKKNQPEQAASVEEIPNPPLQEKGGSIQVPAAIAALNASYSFLLPQLKKSVFLLSTGSSMACELCQQSVDAEKQIVVICPHHDCNSISHLTCMSRHFRENHQDQDQDHMLPMNGSCPSCKRSIEWLSLVKEASLRTLSPTLTTKLLKASRRQRHLQDPADEGMLSEDEEVEDCDEDDVAFQELFVTDNELQEAILAASSPSLSPVPHATDQNAREAESDDDGLPPSGQQLIDTSKSSNVMLEVPDSEWGNVEVVG